MKRYVRFSDLKAAGIVDNWVTLNERVRRDGFPPGIKLGPNTRAWAVEDVEAWLAARPLAAAEPVAA